MDLIIQVVKKLHQLSPAVNQLSKFTFKTAKSNTSPSSTLNNALFNILLINLAQQSFKQTNYGWTLLYELSEIFLSAVNSCQSAVKLYLQKLLNLTLLSSSTLNKALLNILLINLAQPEKIRY